MTTASAAAGAEQEPIDLSWWAAALMDGNGRAREYETPEVLSFDLARLRDEAEVEAVKEGHSLRARVLDVLAKAASPMLVPDSWTEPYAPAVEFGRRRSFVPDDLNKSDLELLARLVPLIEHSLLRARVADIAWTYGDRGDMDLLNAAVDSYRSLPLKRDIWIGVGRDAWRRALELSMRRGKAGRPTVEQMTAQLADFLHAADRSAGFMLIQISDLLSEAKIDRARARGIADRFMSIAVTVVENHRLRRAYEREAASWFARVGETNLANDCVKRIAEAYVEEADARLARANGVAAVVASFIEQAIATLRSLPRKYRTTHGLDARLQHLRERLADLRTLTLEQMIRIESDPIDITHYVNVARNAVAGKPRLEALARLSGLVPLPDPTSAMATHRELLSRSLARLFGSSTLSADARKVDTRGGVSGNQISDDDVFAEVVRSTAHRVDLAVQALVHPALEVLLLEHRFDIAFLTEICYESPVVPRGHANLWARGLWHGFAGDFPSAISVLVPQVEQMVRDFLQVRGVFTFFVDERGVESKKGLNALLEMPEASRLLGADLAFELRVLLCEQVGPNLRNEVAHGLLNDPQSWSATAVYTWWLCLRLVYVPYFNMLSKEQDDSELTG